MLTTAPHLHTRRPSPTTVEFIVTTKPHLTLSLRVLLLSTFLLRIILGLSTLLLLYSKWTLSPYAAPIDLPAERPFFFSDDFIWYAITVIHTSPIGVSFTKLAAQIPVALLVPVSALLGYLVITRMHVEEKLLVIRGLGVQTSTSSATFLSGATTRFIPTEKIQDVLVNEAFRGFEVRYYLVVVVEGEEDMVVVFPKLLPRRRIVETVWRGGRDCLYDSAKGEKEGARN